MTLLDLRGHRLVLASASPRRFDLHRSVGLEFDVLPADIDEAALDGELPSSYVARLAREKALVVAGRVSTDAIVVGADTTVDVDGRILEKPVDHDDARTMLRLLSGRAHAVHTGVSVVVSTQVVWTEVVSTIVEFVELSDATIEWYLATGEADGKAGSYGIQGVAAAFVRRVEGSVTNVIGLPLAETLALLQRRVSVAGD